VKILEGCRPADFGGRRSVPSGGTVERKKVADKRGSGSGSGPASAVKSRDGEPISERLSASGSD
jgi:hypothetical protein